MKYSVHEVPCDREKLGDEKDPFYALECRLESEDSPKDLLNHLCDQLFGFYGDRDPTRDFLDPASWNEDFDSVPERETYDVGTWGIKLRDGTPLGCVGITYWWKPDEEKQTRGSRSVMNAPEINPGKKALTLWLNTLSHAPEVRDMKYLHRHFEREDMQSYLKAHDDCVDL